MGFIHDFWVNNFPMFSNLQFIYYFLDLCTIMVLIKSILIIPRMVLIPRRYVRDDLLW